TLSIVALCLLSAVGMFALIAALANEPVAQKPAAGKPGKIFRDCPDCPEMVVLPAGSFTMGSSAEEKSWAASHGGSMKAVADEAPQHQVSLPSFALILAKCFEAGKRPRLPIKRDGFGTPRIRSKFDNHRVT